MVAPHRWHRVTGRITLLHGMALSGDHSICTVCFKPQLWLAQVPTMVTLRLFVLLAMKMDFLLVHYEQPVKVLV
jgi:hypothetical protein